MEQMISVEKRHTQRDFKISRFRTLELQKFFFITKGIFRDSGAQLKVTRTFKVRRVYDESTTKKEEYQNTVTLLSAVSQFTSLSCKETFLPVVTSASTAVQKASRFAIQLRQKLHFTHTFIDNLLCQKQPSWKKWAQEITGRSRETPSCAPFCAHYFQAPATQAMPEAIL